MKILWINPEFLDYRIPVYQKINQLTDGNFYLMFSNARMKERVKTKLKYILGKNSIGLSNEKIFDLPRKGDFANTDLKIPFQPGLLKAIFSIDADIIISEGFFQWTPYAIFRSKISKKPIIIAYERTAHTERNCPKWRTMYRKIICRLVDGFSVNGILTKEYLLTLGVPEEKIHIGGMSADSVELVKGVDSISIEEITELRKNLIIKGGLTFLYVGQLIERKGVIYLLQAWESHIKYFPKDTLIIIGSGPLYSQYLNQFQHNASIKFLGLINYDIIYKYYAISDVFIIPTLEDNWSLVVPEAMACGLPIACSIYNGCYPELVRENINGKIFDPLKEIEIMETLKYFHTTDLSALKENSKKIEKQFSAEIVAENIFKTCTNLI